MANDEKNNVSDVRSLEPTSPASGLTPIQLLRRQGHTLAKNQPTASIDPGPFPPKPNVGSRSRRLTQEEIDSLRRDCDEAHRLHKLWHRQSKSKK